MKDQKVLQLIHDSTQLAREIEPLIKKQAACRSRATEVADTLVKYDIISIEKRAEVEFELQDPEYAYAMITKLAKAMPAASFGEISEDNGKPLGSKPGDSLLNWILS